MLAGGKRPGPARDQLDRPTGLILTDAGDLIVCDSLNHRIQRWSPEATYGETILSDVACHKLFAGKKGEILFSNEKNEIIRWLPAENRTELVMQAAGKSQPRTKSNMFLSRSGNVYVADTKNNRILKYKPGQSDADIVVVSGPVSPSFGPSSFNAPTFVIADDEETLYIMDSLNKRIVRLTADGVADIVAINNEFSVAPNALHFDRHGNLYASNFNRVMRYDIDTSACSKFLKSCSTA